MMLLPWLEPIWERLNQARLRGRLPHALLFTGPAGVGKQMLAQRLAQALLCEAPDTHGHACGTCAACGWLRAGTHPDLLVQRPEEAGKSIKVDEIRALCGSLSMTSHAGRYKVAIIQPADALNVNAANSLLKTLEEPTDRTAIILVCTVPGRLPATIRSRCQAIPFPLPEQALVLDWLESRGLDSATATRALELARGSPLKALEFAETGAEQLSGQCLKQLQQVSEGTLDPLQVAAEWVGQQETAALEWWGGWIGEVIRWRLGGATAPECGDGSQLQQIVETVDCRVLFDLADRIANALNSLGSGLNRQLILEDLFISWAGQFKDGPRRQNASGR